MMQKWNPPVELTATTAPEGRPATVCPHKPRIRVGSVKWLDAIDHDIREFNYRGACLHEAASDRLDGWATRDELDDLIRRGLLTVIRYDPREVHWSQRECPDLCGTTWTVALTGRAIRAFWPDRMKEPKRRPPRRERRD